MVTNDFVETSIGQVNVSEEDGVVTVAFHANDTDTLRCLLEYGEVPTMTLRKGRKVPKPFQEVTQNGSTFEVLGVRANGAGYDLLNGNTGVWEPWVE